MKAGFLTSILALGAIGLAAAIPAKAQSLGDLPVGPMIYDSGPAASTSIAAAPLATNSGASTPRIFGFAIENHRQNPANFSERSGAGASGVCRQAQIRVASHWRRATIC